MFADCREGIPELRAMEEQLNSVRNQLELRTEPLSWKRHTGFCSRAGLFLGGLRNKYEPEMSTIVNKLQPVY